jgi:hypothetical protein
MMTRTLAIAALVILAVATPLWAQLAVTPTNDANTLVNNILTTGITLVGSPTYTGGTDAAGLFTGGNAGNGLGIPQGIILTNGAALGALGPNNQNGYSVDLGLSGDPDLNVLAGGTTFDAGVLQFSFTTDTGSVFFNYQFASEEYPGYVNQFNDVFGFFLDGVNVALIPTTTLPVSINDVNRDVNPGYFVDNWIGGSVGDDFSGAGGPLDIQYDGLTTPFQIGITGLSTSDVHTIRLAIADTSDHALDSAVFIQGFGGTPTPIETTPEPASLIIWSLLGAIGVTAGWLRRKRASAA